MSPIEGVGVIFGLLSVWFAVKEDNWTWPTGIVNSVLFGVLFYGNRWYVNVGLQVLYVLYNLYSWYMWRYGGQNRTAPRIGRTPARAWWALVPALGLGTLLVGRIFTLYTDDTVPYWDAVTVALSLVAQYMMTRKWLEHWGVWIVANGIYFGLGLASQNYVFAGLQIVYIGLSLMGFLAWRQDWRAARVVAVPAEATAAPGAVAAPEGL
jgi:nicotinamide mononucleotide transporter